MSAITNSVTPAAVKPNLNKLNSEDAIPNAIDKCIADALIKAGSSTAVGGALSLVLFRRRMWPVTLAFGVGLGMAVSNCENNLNKSLSK